MENKKYGIIWDQTGVLYRYGRNNVTQAFTKVLETHGVKSLKDMFREKYKGTSLKNQAKMWKNDLGLEIPIPLDQFSKEAVSVEMDLIDRRKEHDENLIRFLDKMQENNVPMIVASSSTKERAEKILSVLGLKKYFIGVVSCEDVLNHEPSIDTLALASKKLGIPLSQCIVIEDSASGILAAKKAGCLAIGYAIYSEEQYTSLINAGADIVLKNFRELNLSLVERLIGRKNENRN